MFLSVLNLHVVSAVTGPLSQEWWGQWGKYRRKAEGEKHGELRDRGFHWGREGQTPPFPHPEGGRGCSLPPGGAQCALVLGVGASDKQA